MKTVIMIALSLVGLSAWTACNRADASIRALDLETGETIRVVEDTTTGQMVNQETGEPVTLYVDKSTRDTIYGPTGEVVNNELERSADGKYVYNGKTKIDGDEYKYKDGDYKEKYEDGEYKVKDGDYKRKVEEDGDVKIKNGDSKVKIDGETGEVKVDD